MWVTTPVLTTSSSLWFISACCLLSPLTSQTCTPTPKGLSAWITFDEPAFPAALRIPGHVGTALRFDGNARFAELPASTPGLKVGDGDFSLELWLRTKDAVRIRNIVDFRDRAPRGYLLYMHRGSVGVQVAAGSHVSDTIAAAYPVADGVWHHVVAIVKRLPPQPARLYVDGVPRTQSGRSVPLANLDHDVPMWFARHHRNALVDRENIFFTGDVDEFSVYKRALAPADVMALFRAGRAGKCRK